MVGSEIKISSEIYSVSALIVDTVVLVIVMASGLYEISHQLFDELIVMS